MLFAIGRFLSWVLLRLFGHLCVIGADNIPVDGGVLLAANHTSYFDPPIAGVVCPRPTWFMGKAELFAIPVLGWIISRVHSFPVRRGTADRQAMQMAIRLLGEGKVVTIFIEGARSPDGKLQAPVFGPAMIALRAGVPIVPMAIINSDHFLPRKAKFIHFSRVKVVIGEPMHFPEYAGRSPDRAALTDVGRRVMMRIAEMMREHGADDRVPEGYMETGPMSEHHATAE